AWSFARPSAPAVSRGGEARVTPSFAAAGQPRASRVSEDAYAKLRALAADRPAGWIAQEGVRARRIAGRVVDGGKPAVGALVRLTSELSLAGMVPALEQRTDADGRFDFGEQVAREYAVGAAAPGRLAAILRIDLRHPSPSQPADALELSLLPCATELYGVVTDAGGSPVPHARLLREDVIGTEAGADGRYALCVLPMATFVDALQVVVRADGYGAAVIEATPSGRVRRDIVLTPEAVVAGRVVDEHGAPVALAKVWLEPDLGRRRPPEQSATLFAVTGDDGRFRIEGVRAGQHRVGAAARGQTAQRHTVALAAGERDELVLTLAATGQLRGRVVRNGQPVIGATVRPRYGVSDSAVSQPDGSFVLDRVPPGEIELTAYPYVVKSPETVAVTGGAATDVTLQVAHMASLRGTIRRHGTPVPYARVTVRGPSQLAARADAEGRYQLEGLYPGTHVYVADDVRMRAFGDGEVEIAEGEDRVLDLELTSGARVAGMVVDAAGQPVASAFVRLRAASGDEGRCVTDDRGAFDCASMTGGAPYVLGVFAGDDTSMPYPFAGPAPAPIALADGDAFVDGVRVSVDPRRLAISGTVVDAEGHAIPDARVQAWGVGARRDWRWNAAPSAVTDIDGMFTIASLAPGTYGLEVSVLDGPRGARRDVDAGATGVTLVVEEPTCVDPSQTSRVRDEPAGLTSRPVGRVVWGEGAEIIELLGWNLPGTVRRGEPFTITTYYRTIAPPDRAWAVFVHIDGGKARHQADHDPLGGTCSSSTWQPGDILIDRVTTTINPKWVPPGRYTVWTGFYTGWAPTWRNFEVHAAPASMRDSNHRIKIADIVLE
ncbi:MAG: carboxypeptidase-like regulatory domain-containing protein, partial [Deltaproteobacteria bacterium]|nr:carboxypeptidase-like regulatory domain-containing protein [Kofleriaceae bacterium]